MPAWAGLAAACAAAGAPLGVLLWMSGTVALPIALAAMALVAAVVLGSGRLALRAAGASGLPLPAAWVLGVLASSLGVYALAEAFGLLASTAFAVWTAGIAVAAIAVRLRAGPGAPVEAGGLVALLACGAVSVLWCREIAAAPLVLARDGVLTGWIDFFVHGGVISHFGDSRAFARGSVDLADVPLPPYHYASYLLPAALAEPLSLAGLPLATSVWLPLGFLTMCAGACALGAALAGRPGAIAALAAVALVPDAASYGLRNGYFGFHWNLLAVPGGAYAVGFCLLAAAFLARWTREGGWRPLAAAALLVLGSMLVRVHVFALAFPALLAAAAAASAAIRRRKLVSLALACAAFAAFVVAFYALAPDAVPAMEKSLEGVHGGMEPTAYPGFYRSLLESHGAALAVPAGLLLVYAASLGAFLLAYPLSVWLLHRSRGLRAADLVPPAFLACYLLLMVTAPIPPNGDATEFTQRPFILLYAVVAVWTAAGFTTWAAAQGSRVAVRAQAALFLAAAAAFLALWPQIGALGVVPRFQWGREYAAYKVEPGLPQVAARLRAQAAPGDLFAVEGLKTGWVPTDVASQLAALTGMPAYLARPFVHIAAGGRRSEVARERHGALERVAAARDAAAALASLRELGVRWYVVTGVEGPRWDRARRGAAFASGRVAVYSSR
jgi:hypothetical protein